MRRVGIGLLGLGTVGSGVASLLASAGDRLARRGGQRLEVAWALVRDPEKPRDVAIERSRLLTAAERGRIWADPGVSVVVELLGGIEPARTFVLEALAAGKDVVTANKALLAEHGRELFAAARAAGRAIAFEASVGGGIPIVQALGVGLAANQVQSLAAIVNGTCNFILTAMTDRGMTYEAALGEAQRLGYAEPDPTLDVDGTDTAHKLAVLSQLAFGATVTTEQIPRQGIDQLQVADIRFAGELGYTVKLLASAKLHPTGLELRVAPRLVRQGTPLADVKGPYNAIRVVGDAVGDTLFYGRGAGAMPTASAVVGDILDVVVGRAGLTFRALDLWPERDDSSAPRLVSAERVWSRYYLRFTVRDRPGVVAAIAKVLGDQAISIASVIQHETAGAEPDDPVPLIIMTHQAVEAAVQRALALIDGLEVVVRPSVCLGVED